MIGQALHQLRMPFAARSHLGLGALVVVSLTLTLGLSACNIVPGANTGPTATPGPSPTPTPTVLYQNALTSSSSDWTDDQNCFFGTGGYHINGSFLCIAPAGTLTNVDVAVQVKQISGATTIPYGIGFRRPGTGNRYEFDIDSNSKWIFYKCSSGTCDAVIDYTPNSAIQGGLNTANTLEVRAVGSHFDFFVNSAKVGQADDTTYASGEVGLSGDDGIEVVFSNLVITKPAS